MTLSCHFSPTFPLCLSGGTSKAIFRVKKKNKNVLLGHVALLPCHFPAPHTEMSLCVARQGTNSRGKTWSHLAHVGEQREKDGGSVRTTATLGNKTEETDG